MFNHGHNVPYYNICLKINHKIELKILESLVLLDLSSYFLMLDFSRCTTTPQRNSQLDKFIP